MQDQDSESLYQKLHDSNFFCCYQSSHCRKLVREEIGMPSFLQQWGLEQGLWMWYNHLLQYHWSLLQPVGPASLQDFLMDLPIRSWTTQCDWYTAIGSIRTWPRIRFKRTWSGKNENISYITILVPEAHKNNKLQFPLVFRTEWKKI